MKKELDIIEKYAIELMCDPNHVSYEDVDLLNKKDFECLEKLSTSSPLTSE